MNMTDNQEVTIESRARANPNEWCIYYTVTHKKLITVEVMYKEGMNTFGIRLKVESDAAKGIIKVVSHTTYDMNIQAAVTRLKKVANL